MAGLGRSARTTPSTPSGGSPRSRAPPSPSTSRWCRRSPRKTAAEHIAKYTMPGRISNVGVEDLHFLSSFASATDGEPRSSPVVPRRATELVVPQIHRALFRVLDGEHPRHCPSGHRPGLRIPRRQIPGDQRTALCLRDQWHEHLQPVQRLYSRAGRHDFVTGSEDPDPTCSSTASPWTRLRTPGHITGTRPGCCSTASRRTSSSTFRTARQAGPASGSAGAPTLFWNSQAGSSHLVESPPGARNWSIGCSASSRSGNGTFESFGTAVTPRSLYLQQLQDRLGTSGATPSPSPPSAQALASLTNWPARTVRWRLTGCGPAPAPAPGPGPPCRPKKLSRAARNADAARPRLRSPARPRRRHGDTDVGLRSRPPRGCRCSRGPLARVSCTARGDGPVRPR